jgi:hypothetical protein
LWLAAAFALLLAVACDREQSAMREPAGPERAHDSQSVLDTTPLDPRVIGAVRATHALVDAADTEPSRLDAVTNIEALLPELDFNNYIFI